MTYVGLGFAALLLELDEGATGGAGVEQYGGGGGSDLDGVGDDAGLCW